MISSDESLVVSDTPVHNSYNAIRSFEYVALPKKPPPCGIKLISPMRLQFFLNFTFQNRNAVIYKLLLGGRNSYGVQFVVFRFLAIATS